MPDNSAPPECEMCCNSGYVEEEELEGYVSHEMAIDGGDRSLEGQPVYRTRHHPCPKRNWEERNVG